MAFFWLNQKTAKDSTYHDDVGEVYHYRGTTPGAKQLSEGDKFVYYRPGAYEIFGTGEIAQIDKEENNPENTSGITTHYYAHIQNYTPFDPPLILKGVGETDLKSRLSFLKDRPGLTGVPQHSIHEISEDDFEMIIDAAGVDFDL